MTYILRPATQDDIPAIARVHVEGWRGAYGGIVDQAYLDALDEAQRAERWQEIFNPADKPLLMALGETGQIAGFVNYGRLMTPPPGSSPIRPLYAGEVYALYLLPAFYRRGIGTALLRAAARDMTDMGYTSLCLWVLEKNIRAVSFYKKNGGERCGKKDVGIGSGTYREICFGWRDTAALCAFGQDGRDGD